MIRKPAEAARAPEGPTNTATGTRDLSIASMICRIEVSRPPGVSRRSTTRGAPAARRGIDGGDHVRGADRVHDARQLHDGYVGPGRGGSGGGEDENGEASADPDGHAEV